MVDAGLSARIIKARKVFMEDTNGIVMGFTGWNYHFCSLEMAERKGVPELVSEWNDIHNGHKTNADIWPYEKKEVI